MILWFHAVILCPYHKQEAEERICFFRVLWEHPKTLTKPAQPKSKSEAHLIFKDQWKMCVCHFPETLRFVSCCSVLSFFSIIFMSCECKIEYVQKINAAQQKKNSKGCEVKQKSATPMVQLCRININSLPNYFLWHISFSGGREKTILWCLKCKHLKCTSLHIPSEGQ